MNEWSAQGDDFFGRHIGERNVILQWNHPVLPKEIELGRDLVPLPEGTELYWVDLHSNANFSHPCLLAVKSKEGVVSLPVRWWPNELENWSPVWDPFDDYGVTT